MYFMFTRRISGGSHSGSALNIGGYRLRDSRHGAGFEEASGRIGSEGIMTMLGHEDGVVSWGAGAETAGTHMVCARSSKVVAGRGI